MVKHLSGSLLAVFSLAAFVSGCSDAPLVVQQANRIVLVELFSTPPDE